MDFWKIFGFLLEAVEWAFIVGIAAYFPWRILLTVHHWWVTLRFRSKIDGQTTGLKRIWLDNWFVLTHDTRDEGAPPLTPYVEVFNKKILKKGTECFFVRSRRHSSHTTSILIGRSASSLLMFARLYVFVVVKDHPNGLSEWWICGSEYKPWMSVGLHHSHYKYSQSHVPRKDGTADVAWRTDYGAAQADWLKNLVTKTWLETIDANFSAPVNKVLRDRSADSERITTVGNAGENSPVGAGVSRMRDRR